MLSEKDKYEIRELYRNAKHQKKQISILAQLYAAPEKEIRIVLGLIEMPPGWQEPKRPAVNQRVWPMDVRNECIGRVLHGMSCKHAGMPYGAPAHTVGQWMSIYYRNHPEERDKRKR